MFIKKIAVEMRRLRVLLLLSILALLSGNGCIRKNVDLQDAVDSSSTPKVADSEARLAGEVSLNNLKDGDLLFVAKGKSNAITDVTEGVNGLKIDHVGIFLKVDTTRYVLEAYPPTVALTQFHEFKARIVRRDGKARIVVGRVIIDFNLESSIRKAMSYIGRKYDYLYLPDDRELYCSELVQKSYVDRKGQLVFTPIPMTFRDKDGKIPEAFVSYYEKMKVPIPEGAPGSNPGELSRRPQLKIGY